MSVSILFIVGGGILMAGLVYGFFWLIGRDKKRG